MRVRVFLAGFALLVAGACGSGDSDESQTSASAPATTAASATAATSPPNCAPAPIEKRAAATLIVGMPAVRQSSDRVVAEVLDVGVGGILITSPNVASSEQIGQLISDIKARAARPILMVTGEESGRVQTFRELVGRTPSARRLAAEQTPEQVKALATQVGTKLAALGIDLTLAPVADLDGGPANGIVGDRSFSADPNKVAQYALAWSEGLAAANVRPTAKHFPGHGRTRDDSHLGLPRVDATLDELKALDLAPFTRLIEGGVPAVMLDHIVYTALDPALPASLAPKAYELLRSLGFNGVAITDSVGMGAVNLKWDFPVAAVMAIQAGADAVLTTDGTQARRMRDALVAAVREGKLPEQRLNEAAARVTALAGGDPNAFACHAAPLPKLAARRR